MDISSKGFSLKWSPPDVVGVGVQKAGTSSVSDFLRNSGMSFPRAAKSPNKELHWFKHSGRFGGIKKFLYPANFVLGSLRGEFTPNYIEHPLILSQLAEAAPEAKIIVMLRNPTHRTISSLNHARGIGKLNPHSSPAELLNASWLGEGNGWLSRAIRRGTYVSDLQNLFRLFPSKQVFVGYFEHWVDPKQGLRLAGDLAEFIGVPSPRETGISITKVNSASHNLDKSGAKPLEPTIEDIAFLDDYFHQFRAPLEELVGPLPW